VRNVVNDGSSAAAFNMLLMYSGALYFDVFAKETLLSLKNRKEV